MNIIHFMADKTLPRLVASSLEDRLRVMPAVVVTGARQTGKSTLAQQLTPGSRRFFTLDDLDVLDAARRDPESLLGGNQPVTIDEVQREPDLLHAVKRAIDLQRQPGRFLLTGSANLLLMRQVSESLAGRASYLTLWPMTRREQRGLGRAGDSGKNYWRRQTRTGPTWLPPTKTCRKTGERWRAGGDSLPQHSNWIRTGTGRSGLTATCVPTWNGTCKASPPFPHCLTSAV